MQTHIYILTHDFEIPESLDNGKFLGAYSSLETATAAKDRYTRRPGFSDFPNGLIIDAYPIGDDHWTSGFGPVAGM